MKLLLTNDDGFFADGLQALYDVLSRFHDITVVAPDRERSAVGHGITLDAPLRCHKISSVNGMNGYAVNGLPADCVKLGVNEIFNSKPEMVISGINPGANLGVNVNYSGTVAAAKEAALNGIPAIAISIVTGEKLHFDDAAQFVAGLANEVLDNGLEYGTFLNVNFPNLPLEKIRGVKLSRQGMGMFPEYFEKRLDPRNKAYYWQGCDASPSHQHSDSDSAVVSQGFVSITPIKCDMTDYNGLKYLKKWGIENGS